MSLEGNLSLGKAAIDHVKCFRLQSSNQRSNRIASLGGVEAAIKSPRRVGIHDEGPLAERILDLRNHGKLAANRLKIFWLAERAKAAGIGNCTEASSVVFQFLCQKNVRPIDIMSFTNPVYDHVWVVIGLAGDGLQLRRHRNGGPRVNLRDWGPEAVWVDGWQNGGCCFAVDDLVKGKVRNLRWQSGLHSAEAIEAGFPDSFFGSL